MRNHFRGIPRKIYNFRRNRPRNLREQICNRREQVARAGCKLLRANCQSKYQHCGGSLQSCAEKNIRFDCNFSPKDWSVYRQPIRTNNDIEGWHHALNRRAGGKSNLPLYILIELLHREAKLTAITVRLVSDNKLKRIQRKVYRQLQTKLFASWDKYDNREKTAAQLLKCCAKLNGPARVQ